MKIRRKEEKKMKDTHLCIYRVLHHILLLLLFLFQVYEAKLSQIEDNTFTVFFAYSFFEFFFLKSLFEQKFY